MSQPASLILVLVVSDYLVNALVYQREPSREEELVLLAVGEEQSWSGEKKEDFLEAAAGAITSVLERIEGGEKEVGELFFVVSPFWTVNGEEILESKKEGLQEICRRYSWRPGGFVIDDEAMVYSFQEKEEGLPSFIALFFAPPQLRLSLVHLGKIKGRLKLKVGERLTPEEVAEGLTKFNFSGVLPPQIIAWGKISPQFENKMVEYPWLEKKEGIFLHLPEVKLLDWPQLGLVFKPIISHKVRSEPKETTSFASPKKLSSGEEEQVEKETSSLPWGFSFTDVAALTSPEEKMVEREKKEAGVEEERSVVGEEEKKKRESYQWKEKIRRVGEGIKEKLRRGGEKGRWGVIGFGGASLLFLFSLFNLKAEISLFVAPQQLEKKISVELRQGGEFKKEEGVIPVKALTVELEKSAEGKATGTSLIGEKAKGKVVVYNRTGKEKVFPRGTVILGPEKLEFIFQEEVKVASKTPDLASGVDRWGEGEVRVVAQDIGSRYNLAGGTIFTIKGYSADDFLVKNKEEFSGGTSREVTAVSQKDIDDLRKKLEEELKKKAEEELVRKKSGEEKVIEGSFSLDSLSFESDKKAGQEGERFKGTLSMRASLLVLSSSTTDQLIDQLFKEELGEEWVFNPEGVKISFSPLKKGDGFWQGELTVQAKAYPSLNEGELKKRIKGRSKKEGEKILRDISRVYRYSLVNNPSWLSFWPWLPWREENINILIKE